MKYFIDTEFIEGTQDKTFLGFKYGETKPTIDLISIGIVSESIGCGRDTDNDGNCDIHPKGCNQKEYYAISKDFNLKAAWKNEWVRENVLKQIFNELLTRYINQYCHAKSIGVFLKQITKFNYKELKYLINKYGKTNKQIAQEIIEFIYPTKPSICNTQETEKSYYDELNKLNGKPEFYAYYADYDWVVFAQLFGRMIDLPKGFPMYCRDLKQEMDRKVERTILVNTPIKLIETVDELKQHPNYPKQTNEHNALADAKWNYELYKFLNSL